MKNKLVKYYELTALRYEYGEWQILVTGDKKKKYDTIIEVEKLGTKEYFSYVIYEKLNEAIKIMEREIDEWIKKYEENHG